MHGGMNLGQEAERDPKAPVPECEAFCVQPWNDGTPLSQCLMLNWDLVRILRTITQDHLLSRWRVSHWSLCLSPV